MGNRRMGLARMEALLEAVDRDLNLANSTLTDCIITTSAACSFTGTVKMPGILVAEPGNDTTVTSLVSGNTYYFGTATGLIGAADASDQYTFKLPTPTQVGETIVLYATNASVYAKKLGFVTNVPASQLIKYVAYEAAAVVESSTTVVGAAGSQAVFVDINASHSKIGDKYICTALSTTQWLLEIHGSGGLIVAGDIAPANGNANGNVA